MMQGIFDLPSQISSQIEIDRSAITSVDGSHHAGSHRLPWSLDGQRSAHRRIHPHRTYHEVYAMHLQLVGSQLGHRYRPIHIPFQITATY